MNALQTILVLEDEPLLLDHVVDVLSEVGYRVLPASNTAEALHYLTDSTCRIDLMFSDIRVPGSLNGLALAQEAQHMAAGIARDPDHRLCQRAAGKPRASRV